MKKVSVIDVTLRDGGCVNNFDFGNDDMNAILEALNMSGVNCIEVGYIDEQKGSEYGRSQFSSERAIQENILRDKKAGTDYLAMIDYGTYDVNKLRDRTEGGIDGIRLAFHKDNARDIAKAGRIIIDKGYKLFIQPMLALRYTDYEYLKLIDMVNNHLPGASAFYIVDSFGEMRHNDVERALHLVDHNLKDDIPYGFHSHNNLQLSYANAISALSFPSERNLYIDSSLMGMGKGAGNLNTELLLEHISIYHGGQYTISPLLNVMDTVLPRIKAEHNWGYSVEYYLSSINHCSPSYARYFQRKLMLPIEQLSELLGAISEEKRISFDKIYADELYSQYISYDVDDRKTICELTDIFCGKRVLLIATGASTEAERDKIASFIKANDVITVTVNTTHPEIPSDFIFISKWRKYKSFINKMKDKSSPPLICVSSVRETTGTAAYTVNYSDYICEESDIESNTGMMAINLMRRLGVDELILAGFDGLGYKSHRKDALPDPMEIAEYDKLNKLIANHIREAGMELNITFLTKSMYDMEVYSNVV